MTLISRHWNIVEAVRDSLNADTDIDALTSGSFFLARKKPYRRGNTWDDGGYCWPGRVAPNPQGNENALDFLIFEVGVTCVASEDGDLVTGAAANLAVIERAEDIFRNKAHGKAPAPMVALSSAYSSGADGYLQFQQTTVMPGSRFADQAFEAGHDASTCIVKVEVILQRRSVASLGA